MFFQEVLIKLSYITKNNHLTKGEMFSKTVGVATR